MPLILFYRKCHFFDVSSRLEQEKTINADLKGGVSGVKLINFYIDDTAVFVGLCAM